MIGLRVALLLALILPCASDPGCEDAWGGFATSCYIFLSLPATWSDAQSFCQSLDSNLVAVETRTENDWLTAKVSVTRVSSFWTGGKADNYRQWYWQPSNKPIKRFENWADGEPNNYQNTEYCLEFRSNSEWNDMNCNAPRPFVCEKAATSFPGGPRRPHIDRDDEPIRTRRPPPRRHRDPDDEPSTDEPN